MTTNGLQRFAHTVLCCMPQLLFVLMAVGAYYGGYWLLLPVVFLMLAVPLLDTLTGWQDTAHFQTRDFSSIELFLLHWNTRLYALFYLATVILFAGFIDRFGSAEIGFIIGSASLLGGIAFGAAHELLHEKNRLDQFLQRITTAFLFYPHYRLIHTQSHHVNAATEHDQNTAWMNEGIYAYLVRTIPGSMRKCWQLEMKRLRKKGLSGWSGVVHNQMLIFAAGQLGILAGMYFLAGWKGLSFYIAHLIGAHVVLEAVNYIQHYGLMRDEQDGQYEKTTAKHSWDTYHYFSSYVTFRVGHHSFHHTSSHPYYLLPTEDKAPKLPVGYFWAIPMVMVPPLWRRMINPKLVRPTLEKRRLIPVIGTREVAR